MRKTQEVYIDLFEATAHNAVPAHGFVPEHVHPVYGWMPLSSPTDESIANDILAYWKDLLPNREMRIRRTE